VPTYRLHAHDGDDLGLLEHPAPNEPGDAVMLANGREALVTARVEARPGPLEAQLEVVAGNRSEGALAVPLVRTRHGTSR
jgi:hypothetical protein